MCSRYRVRALDIWFWGVKIPSPTRSRLSHFPLPQLPWHPHPMCLFYDRRRLFLACSQYRVCALGSRFWGSKPPPPLVLAFPTSHSLNYHGTPIPCVSATTPTGRFPHVANIEWVRSIPGLWGPKTSPPAGARLSHLPLPQPPPHPHPMGLHHKSRQSFPTITPHRVHVLNVQS